MPFCHLPGKSTAPRKVDLCCALNTGSSHPLWLLCSECQLPLYLFHLWEPETRPVSCRPCSEPPSIAFLCGVWQQLAFPFILLRFCNAIPSRGFSSIVIPSLLHINESQTYQLNASHRLKDTVFWERSSCVLAGNFAHCDFLKVLL